MANVILLCVFKNFSTPLLSIIYLAVEDSIIYLAVEVKAWRIYSEQLTQIYILIKLFCQTFFSTIVLPGSLPRTTEWLHAAAAKVSSSDVRPSSSSCETNVPSHKAAAGEVSVCSPTVVLNQAYIDLLHWEPGKDYPEVREQYPCYYSDSYSILS